MTNYFSTLAGEEYEGRWKWSASVLGADQCIYGIPNDACHVVKYNPIDQSLKEIGPNLGPRSTKWMGGVLSSKNGCIYCAPYGSSSFLKIDTIKGVVETLDLAAEESGYGMWGAGTLALDGCIYFIPHFAKRILRLNPEDETVTSVGDDLGGSLYVYKYLGFVCGIDDCLYGIPFASQRIIKFNPENQSTSFLGIESIKNFMCGNGVLGRDGCIYACSMFGDVVKIDTANETYNYVGQRVDSSHEDRGWGDPILGIDGTIYFPPHNSNRTLKFDPQTKSSSLVGDDLGANFMKYTSGILGYSGAIYCIPSNAKQVVIIDPCKEFVMNLQAEIEQHPETFGRLFEKNEDGRAVYDDAVKKYGKEKIFQIIEDCLYRSSKENFDLFLSIVSNTKGAFEIIYYLLVRDPSFMQIPDLARLAT